MKELSIEEKAKRYDEALAMAKECITYIPDEAVNKYMLNMFPELKESEDERIRGNLIELFHDTVSNDEIFSDYGLDKTEVLAWLEKQGNNANKVGSIFEVGKWIVANESKYTFLLKRGAPRFQAENTNGDIYSFYLLPNGEEEYHLWSIEDAKEGDVLAWDYSKCIALFESIFDEDIFNSHGFVGHCSDIFEPIQGCHNIRGAHPATKEQRDLLFAKMKEAGYKWDATKKQLKKL